MDTCPDCGKEYQRINQHFALSGCGSDDGAKETYTCDLDECNETWKEYPSRIESRGRKSFYCCLDHKYEDSRNGKTVECAWCQSDVYKADCQLNEMGDYSLNNHFCDKECESEFKQSEWVGEDHPSWDGGKVELNCEHCGDKFKTKPAKADKARFCSRECSKRSHYTEIECVNCGDTQERTKFYAERYENSVCSDKCLSEWISNNHRGSDNPSYKTAGGKVGIAKVRLSIGDISWDRRARQVRERDDYTCQQCGKQSDDRDLDVHHIIPIASGGTNSPENLMTLCRSCHRTVESYTEQFIDQYLFDPATD